MQFTFENFTICEIVKNWEFEIVNSNCENCEIKIQTQFYLDYLTTLT